MLMRLRFLVSGMMSALTRRLQRNFYLYLAALLSLGVLLDAGVFHIGENMRQKAFDFMVRNRVITSPPDPQIVIVDVNEASLSALAGEYGRWPWPRQVFGEFLENIAPQQPRAVVFDILFSDADLFNPDSDAYFNEVIAGSGNTFFPFLRLAPEHDALSRVKPGMLPGISELNPGQGDRNATIAVVLPHFEAALASGRIGTHNIYPDGDGIVREYRLWGTDYGWKIPALPLTVAGALEAPQPATQNVLLNWRGKPFSYRYVSFSDVYKDLTSKVKSRPPDEFRDKIVIIGSTAPSLFDLKATAMAKTHPGVEILATAIDNVKHGDYLHTLRGAASYLLISLLLIWLTAAAFFRNVDRDRFNKLFSATQIGLLAVSYIGINLTNTYIDFTGPVTWAIGYFSVAKVYAIANDRALQRWLAFGVKPEGAGLRAWLMPVLLDTPEPVGEATMKKLRGEVLALDPGASVEILRGTQAGVWGLFSDLLVITWICGAEDTERAAQLEHQAGILAQRLQSLETIQRLPVAAVVRHRLHRGLLAADQPLAPQWRSLFAQAIIQLEHPELPETR